MADSALFRFHYSSSLALIAHFLTLPSQFHTRPTVTYLVFPGLFLTSVIPFLHIDVAPLSHLYVLERSVPSTIVSAEPWSRKPVQMSCSNYDYSRLLFQDPHHPLIIVK